MQNNTELIETEKRGWKLVTNPKACGARTTAYTGGNVDEVMKTLMLRIQNCLCLGASAAGHSDSFLHPSPAWYNLRISNTLGVFSV